jgi:hypothetical protein
MASIHSCFEFSGRDNAIDLFTLNAVGFHGMVDKWNLDVVSRLICRIKGTQIIHKMVRVI